MKHLTSWVSVIALACFASCGAAPALAQQTQPGDKVGDNVAVAATGFGSYHSPVVPVDAAHPLPTDTVVPATAVDRGMVVGVAAVQLMPANPTRRGIAVQNQSATASCFISDGATATADLHSLQINPASYYETPPTHVGTGAVSIICTGASTPVYAREW